MKISIVSFTSFRSVGGGMKVIYEYSNYLAEKGHDVTLYYMGNQILSNYRIPEFIRRILVRAIIFYRPRWFKLNKKIKKIAIFEMKNENIRNADVIMATDVRTAFPVSKLELSKGKKFYFIQGFENWQLPDSEVINTYKLNMKNLTVSNWLSEIINGVSNEPAIIIPNSVDTAIFRIEIPPTERQTHTIAFHYRSEEFKGSKYGFEAFEILYKKYPDLKVNIVGIENEPPNLPNYCTYYRNVNSQQISVINNNSSVFVCTSIEEGFGLPGLEGMACGCVLVSTDFYGVREYAENGKNALLCPPKNPYALADTIDEVFQDKMLREKIIENGLLTVKERSTSKSASYLEKILSC